MNDLIQNKTVIWVMLLTAAEAGRVKIPEDCNAIPHANQMQDAGLLICDGDNEWILSSRGMEALTLLERLRDFTLSPL